MKVYVAAPGQHNWPAVPDDVQDRLLTLLREGLSEEALGVSLARSRKRSKTLVKRPVKQHLAIGLRCVLRCLKQKQCAVVFVCTSLSPIILTKPILLLSQMQSIASVRLKNLSAFLTKTFAIPHCAVIAFKLSCAEHPQLQTLVDQLLQIIQGSVKQPEGPSSVTFVPGKILVPYQNPKRVSAGVQKKKKQKTKKK